MHIITSPYALKNSSERLFPASKNRSKRIHKKLVQRYGGEFRQVPAMYRVNGQIIMHPALYVAFQQSQIIHEGL